MIKDFDETMGVVKAHLSANGYSYSRTMDHLRCYRLLGAHMADEGKAYSTHLAKQWLETISPSLNKSLYYSYRRALDKLDSAYHEREIIDTKSHETRQALMRLLPWCKEILTGFSETMTSLRNRSNRDKIRVSVGMFLEHLSREGVGSAGEITHRHIVDYCRGFEGEKRVTIEFMHHSIRKLLNYLLERAIIKESVAMTIDPSVLSRLVFIETLPPDVQGVFYCDIQSPSLSPGEFFGIAAELDTAIGQHNYSQTMIWVFRKTWNEFFVFLEANSLKYTPEIAMAWALHMRHHTVQWGTFRRAFMLFEQYLAHGHIDPKVTYRYLPDRAGTLPEWCRTDFEAYIRKKQRESLAHTTLEMCRNSCLRLLEYLKDTGISSWAEVNPSALKAFHIHNHHATPEGKNAYTCKIRAFLEHLGEVGRIPPNLFMALPSESASRTVIIETLNGDEIAGLYSYRDQVEGAVGLRDAAMILIGLRMGLRASDISKIRFSDISWEDKAISIQQQKTDRFLKIPMPTEVGNAIYRYILEGRPDASSEYVFITHRVPYTMLSRSVCWQALRRAIPGSSHGFRITRKTFASRLLINTVPAGRIAESLGHANNSSVMKYLSTDGEKMRMCALPLTAIPLKGGVLRAQI